MNSDAEYHIEQIPYGKKEIEIVISSRNYLGTLTANYHTGVTDDETEILSAMDRPVGTAKLSEMVRKGMKIVIVVNDVTRPTPTPKLMPPILRELEKGGIPDRDITVLIATGSHRDNTSEEIGALLGNDAYRRLKVKNHHCQNREELMNIGETSLGVPVVINKLYYEADFKILIGTIQPHHSAGYTGGRKSVLPGLASLETLKLHHGYKMRAPEPAMGWIDGNPFHVTALEAVNMAGADFILNVVQNQKKEITHAFAGDVEKAWLAGVNVCRAISEIDTPDDVDIIIASPGGHPKDINLYQSQKAMAPAELVIKRGGTIILPAACPDGVGAASFYQWMKEASKPEDVEVRFKKEGYNIGTSKAWMYSRCLMKASLIVVSDTLSEETLGDMFTRKAQSVDDAIQMALEQQGVNAKILVMKNGPNIVPKRKTRTYI
ncbi:MAG: nickel-dependent lactate racemase [Desulfobacteraceae bacterium]|nr:MAG: nickel-dependent lactate racemase [Desulfobacteraceae bacterium]